LVLVSIHQVSKDQAQKQRDKWPLKVHADLRMNSFQLSDVTVDEDIDDEDDQNAENGEALGFYALGELRVPVRHAAAAVFPSLALLIGDACN
jgi:hypothetical protein